MYECICDIFFVLTSFVQNQLLIKETAIHNKMLRKRMCRKFNDHSIRSQLSQLKARTSKSPAIVQYRKSTV